MAVSEEMDDWPVWVDALEERNRVECRNSGDSLWRRRKRPSIHLHWNAGHGAILAEVSSECSEILGGIARNVSGFTDPAAVAPAIAAASRFIGGSEATAAVVDANTVTHVFQYRYAATGSSCCASSPAAVSSVDHIAQPKTRERDWAVITVPGVEVLQSQKTKKPKP